MDEFKKINEFINKEQPEKLKIQFYYNTVNKGSMGHKAHLNQYITLLFFTRSFISHIHVLNKLESIQHYDAFRSI